MPKLVLVVLAALMLCQPAQARESGWHAVKTKTYGCQSREDLDRLSSIQFSGDKEAFTNAAMTMILAGGCRIFEVGTQVYLEDVAMFAGVSKVRAKGQTVGFWLPYEFLD